MTNSKGKMLDTTNNETTTTTNEATAEAKPMPPVNPLDEPGPVKPVDVVTKKELADLVASTVSATLTQVREAEREAERGEPTELEQLQSTVQQLQADLRQEMEAKQAANRQAQEAQERAEVAQRHGIPADKVYLLEGKTGPTLDTAAADLAAMVRAAGVATPGIETGSGIKSTLDDEAMELVSQFGYTGK